MLEGSTKAIFILCYTLLVILATSLLIGKERRTKWFRKRKKYSLFSRRSPFVEVMHFGYPITIQGAIVAICMGLVIGGGVYVLLYSL